MPSLRSSDHVQASLITLNGLILALLAAPPAHAISTRTLFAPTGAAASDVFGVSVAPAGDVNDDGFDDVIVGAWQNDAGGIDAGRAYVYHGGPGADATADLTLTGAAAGDFFGSSVASAGDVNGDGYPDLIVGAWQNDAAGANAGRAYVYHGGPAANVTADLTLTGAAAGDFFGVSVASAGDINGDGYADLIVGAYLNDVGGADAGRAYVYHGGPAADATADLILTGAAAGDFFGRSVASAGDVNGDGFDDLIVGAYGNDQGGVNAGRAYIFFCGPAADGIADLFLNAAAAGDQFGIAVAPAGDVNGDGHADVVVGANFNDAGGSLAGRAYVYYGGPAADATADVTFTGAAGGDLFGSSVAPAGDVNGDGFADLIVGAYGASVPNAGRAYVFLGGPAADAIADLTLTGAAVGDQYGSAVASAGDVDGDSFDDVIVSADLNDAGGPNAGRAYVSSIYPYRVLSPNGGEGWVPGQPAAVRWLGHDAADLAISFDAGASWSTLLAGVGGRDENEAIVIAPTIVTTGARIRVSYTGQAAKHSTSDASDGVFRILAPTDPPSAAHRLQLTLTGATSGDFFGISSGTAGDINGDGYDDVIAGAPVNDAGGTDAGRAYVYYGGPAGDAAADLTLTGAAAGDFFGASVGTAGDVNGDGYDDVIVGATFNDAGAPDGGSAFVYYGGLTPDAIADLTLTATAFDDRYGASVGTAGDVNGDGFDDLVVGAPLNDLGLQDGGTAFVYYGGLAADATADLILTGATAFDHFGGSVGSAGDVNGDGFADLIVGAKDNDAAGANAGRAYVYYGGRTPDAVADFTLSGVAAADFFGNSVGTAGDVNGDGFADVIVGASFSDAEAPNGGSAFVYCGGPSIDATADLTIHGTVENGRLGEGVRNAGDVNGDGYADWIVTAPNFGRVQVYYGSSAPDAVPDHILAGAAIDGFGLSAGTAGDTNDDGFDDLIVGVPLSDGGGSDAGGIQVYNCYRYVLLSPGGGETWNVGSTQTVSWLGAELADVSLSVDGGRSYDLLRSGVGGEESNEIWIRVPHSPTRFAQIKVTPTAELSGFGESDSTFTIETSVDLLNFSVARWPDGGAEITWRTDPEVGPEGIQGYRLYRLAAGASGNGVRIGPEVITESRFHDVDGASGHTYRLTAVNGLQEELELARGTLAPTAALMAWPLPYRSGDLNVSFAVNGRVGASGGRAEISLYDLSGRLVASLANGEFAGGRQIVKWNGLDARGRQPSPGIYFLRWKSGGEEARLKITVAR